MAIHYNTSFRNYRTAKELITHRPEYLGKDGYYMLYPNGPSDESNRQLVYCDMTTDGGGWMLVARSHPTTINYSGKKWGWRGGLIGSVKDHSQAYQAGWWDNWHPSGNTFTDVIFGNQYSNFNNQWGFCIYKHSALNYSSLMTSDAAISATKSVIKFDTSVWDRTTYPSMQVLFGWPVTGTINNLYFMRDASSYSTYGGSPTSMVTTYCGSDTVLGYAGPWCGGSTVNGSGIYQSGTYVTAGGNRYGGNNQYMIMVR